ncbi:hypothetical protein AUJ46_05365 [Candidatus Peregrinibacteria bacterium CG1_02_54_53]|nr:MAG: hypothetical protein AUJ46_05365 [Candidatus Peregrinibacteria bacterium CG1_02_54_53]
MSDSHTYPRDFFLYLLATVTLYVSVVSGLILLFQFINLAFPDPLSDYTQSIRDSIRWAAAMLTVLFPVFAGTTRFLHKDLERNPHKGEYRIRKWLLYLTIFLAGLVIIGDLIALLYNFLNGDLTGRFLLKIIAVLFVTGLVFAYEFWDARRTSFRPTAQHRAMSYGLSVLVIVVIISGFILGGSPFEQRRIRFDERRASDLQELQYQVIEYWIAKGSLPQTINALESPLTGFMPPADPNTGEAYEYKALQKLTFELCATFETTSTSAEKNRPSVYEPFGTVNFWNHEAGRVCFERTIDPDLYKDRLAKPVPMVPIR